METWRVGFEIEKHVVTADNYYEVLHNKDRARVEGRKRLCLSII